MPTRTRVLILQHLRERKVGVNTARIAHLCLPSSQMFLGIDFSQEKRVMAALEDPSHPAALLFPGDDAIDVRAHPPVGPITLVVLDGTWWQASKLLKLNPILQRLPRYALSPEVASRYRIRRQPAGHCLSTIEVLAEVLGVLENDPVRLAQLLDPFDAMVERQLAWTERNQGKASRHARPDRPRPPIVPYSLQQPSDRVVVACGETNSWPREPGAPPLEVLQWTAVRPATGETFEAFVRPCNPLAPSCHLHLRVARETLEQAPPFEEFAERWHAFRRPDDVLCTWGSFGANVLAQRGLELGPRIDLKAVTFRLLKDRAGAMDACARALGASVQSPRASGRAGERLAILEAIVRSLPTAG